MDPPTDARCHQNFGSSTAFIDVSTTYVIPLLSAVGIAGDSLMLLTLHCGRLTESPYVYLRCIAFSNLVLLICQLSLAVFFCETCQFSLNTVYYLKFYYWYVRMILVNLMKTWLTLLTVFMTIERFVYVKWPMRTRTWCTRKRAKKICIVLFLVLSCAELLIPFQIVLEIEDKAYSKSGTTIRTSDFHCVPRYNGNSSASGFTCYNEHFPLRLPSNASDPSHIVGFPENRNDSESGRPEDSSSNQTSYSLDILHKQCKVPLIPKELNYSYHPIDKSWGILRSSFRKTSILAIANKSTIATEGNLPPVEDLIGHALRVNETCKFILAPQDLRSVFRAVTAHYTKKHQVIVKCVSAVARSGWQTRYVDMYLHVWQYVHVVSTGLLTVFNVLIVLVVRRANRDTKNNVLSDNTQHTLVKRKDDEHRLTLTLLALSSMNIFTDILFITSWPAIARLLYEKVDPPGTPLKIHSVVSTLAYAIEYSAHFYLVAFINRKFKREFWQQVVYGTFKMHKILAGVRSIFPNSSRSTSLTVSRAEE